jgi:hypothetical protein
MKVAICAIARLENNYLRECVEYYLKLGVDTIFLGDNNEESEEHFEDVIGDYIESKFVNVINVRGLKENIQMILYDNIYKIFNDIYDWIGFFDIDEFLEITNDLTLKETLSKDIYKNFDFIRINWECYDDNDLVRVIDNNYNVQERFTHPMANKVLNVQTKAFIRGGLNLEIISPHGPTLVSLESFIISDINKNLRCCNSAGEPCENDVEIQNLTYQNFKIKHYLKTIEEYINLKIKRGYPNNWANRGKLFLVPEYFFTYNKRTPEKEQYINQVMSLKMFYL